MTTLQAEIMQQPQSLAHLINSYTTGSGWQQVAGIPRPSAPLLTGMGSSFHAAWIAALQLTSSGIPAQSFEATDLLHYGASRLAGADLLVYISQSGESGEVQPLAARFEQTPILAVTNGSDSQLARQAQYTLPLLAGAETLVATKTYQNSLALLWLLARSWAGASAGECVSALAPLVERSARILEDASRTVDLWLDTLSGQPTLVFLGHGPHAATARQSAQMLSEWCKLPALNFSVGGFHHGFIEVAGAGLGAVVFAPPGPARDSSLALAAELHDYGARVLVVDNGAARRVSDPPAAAGPQFEEFLSPILDVLPVQVYMLALAGRLGIQPGFRYIQKVVKSL